MEGSLKKTILRKATSSQVARQVARMLGGGRLWSLGAVTEKTAMKTTIGAEGAELFEKQGMQLAEELKTKMPRDSIVLDFGCGIGRPEKFLSSWCKEIYGADISRGMLRLARRRHKGIRNIHFIKNKKTDLSVFEDCTFDFVFSEAVFQHMDKEHAVSMLTELHRVCKRGASVYLQFCNLLCLYSLDSFMKQSKASRILSPNRMRYWLPEEAQRVVQAVGFEVISLEAKSDCRDENRDCMADDYHKDYSIWMFALKK